MAEAASGVVVDTPPVVATCRGAGIGGVIAVAAAASLPTKEGRLAS